MDADQELQALARRVLAMWDENRSRKIDWLALETDIKDVLKLAANGANQSLALAVIDEIMAVRLGRGNQIVGTEGLESWLSRASS